LGVLSLTNQRSACKVQVLNYSAAKDCFSELENRHQVTTNQYEVCKKRHRGNHTSLGEVPGNSKGSGLNGKLILGNAKELGKLVYKTNMKDHLDMYLRTT
jgi:hypothetical protein